MVFAAAATILFAHAPPVMVDPVVTAFSQIRRPNVPVVEPVPIEESLVDLTTKTVKKLLK
jgi:hypothetical protein